MGTKYRSAKAKNPRGKRIYVSGIRFHGTIMREGDFARTVGIMAHEFGHSLGLPDLYDLSFRDEPDQPPKDDSAGIGCWGIMGRGALGCHPGDGPSPLSSWSRERLGWMGPDDERLLVLDAPTASLHVADLHAGGSVIKLRLESDPDLEEEEQEYLLLEHLELDVHHFNRHLPAGGLLIWHVRPLAGDNDREEYQMLELVSADGRFADRGFPLGRQPDSRRGGTNLDFWAKDDAYRSASGGNLGDAGDPFDGVQYRHFDRASNPSTGRARQDLSIRIDRQGPASVLSVSWGVAPALNVATAVVEPDTPQQAEQVELLPNYPNPFAFQTRIPYTLERRSEVRLQIYNALGQMVRRLVDEDQDQGPREVLWDGRDEDGRGVASGVYLNRLQVGDDFVATRPMLRLPGYAQLVPTQDLDAETDRALGDALVSSAATYGVAAQPSVERAAFTGGTEWVTLKLRWQPGEPAPARANLVRALTMVADSAAVLQAMGPVDADRAQVEQIEAALASLAQTYSAQAGLYFYLGAWTQQLRAVVWTAQQQKAELGFDVSANADAGRQLAHYLKALDGDPVLVRSLNQLADRLQAGIDDPLKLDAFAERLEQLAAPLRLW